MLSTIHIKDYALIENITVDFEKGLNIITGETGAGKSILIGALGLILGDRASTEVVRKGSDKSVVEAFFDVENNLRIKKILEDNEIEFSDQLILRREISLKGTNRCFVNDIPISLAIIKEIGKLLVDLHGQHEHQSLLRTETHVEMLDEMGDDIIMLVSRFQNEKFLLSALINRLNTLVKKEEVFREKRELYKFQIDEIDSINPIEDEDKQLGEELNILENAEQLLSKTTQIYDVLYEGENTLYDQFVSIRSAISNLSSIDKIFDEKESECDSVLEQVNDIADFIRNYRDKVDLDPEQLEIVRGRLGQLNLLKKKYNKSINEILNYREQIGEEFELVDNFNDKIEEISAKIDQKRIDCGLLAIELSNKRKEVAGKIEKEIVEQLKYLGVNDSVFKTNFDILEPDDESQNYIIAENKKLKFNNYGIDEIEFFISTNIGEDPKPLAKVASGGEISRIMLAMKSILAKSDKLPLLIFDEIDTGVSGRVAQKVGHVLKNLAAFHQIISITHLPQIAGLADHHYSISKSIEKERVVSKICKLSDEERLEEVAKLISGEEVTEASLNGAKELMASKV
ncbi:MAG: DNA repair protein RecN [Melioribacteraceae bacterium]|nr:DNA repair protein RecN [Melioribacteraceae bacterium]